MEKKYIPFSVSKRPFLLVSMGHPFREGLEAKAPGVSFPADSLKNYVEKLNQERRKYTNGGTHLLPSPPGCVLRGCIHLCDPPHLVPGKKKGCQAEWKEYYI